MRPLKTFLAALVLIGVSLAVPAEVHSAVRDWDNESGDNDWYNSANWNPDGSPAETDQLSVVTGTPHAFSSNVHIDNSGSLTIQNDGTVVTVDQTLYVGRAGEGWLNSNCSRP